MMTVEEFLAEWNDGSDLLLVHTSGSTGEPKPLWVEKRRMEASARITCSFLGLKPGDTALLCLPLDYIAGKMMVVRALTCRLNLLAVAPTGHPLAGPSGKPMGTVGAMSVIDGLSSLSFAAMVPMQVFNSLQVAEERERLMNIGHLIIGGGAVSHTMAEELRDFPNAVWSTYGMTETLSHIALRRLSGSDASEWYTPFDGVSLSQNDEGCLIIDAPAVHDGPLVTNDIVELSNGRFRVLGRKDNVICSGGMKIQTEEIEMLLSQHTSVPFIISKCKDGKFGEAMVMLAESPDDLNLLQTLCQKVLDKYRRPKHFVLVEHLPFTATGKPARKEAERLAQMMTEAR